MYFSKELHDLVPTKIDTLVQALRDFGAAFDTGTDVMEGALQSIEDNFNEFISDLKTQELKKAAWERFNAHRAPGI